MQEFKKAKTKFGKVRYIDVGPHEGEAILFSTGGGAGINLVYAFQWLIESGFRVISINRPGYFDLKLNVAQSIEDHADIYHEVIDQLGIERPMVFGVSMGGLSALYYTKKYPTKALVLWSAVTGEYHPNAEATHSFLGKVILAKYGKSIISWLLKTSARLFPKKTLQTFLKTESTLTPKQRKIIAMHVMNHPEQRMAFQHFINSITPMNALYQGMMDEVEKAKHLTAVNWRSISCPVFAVHSTADKDASLEHAERLQKMIPQLKLKYVKAGGHFVWWGKEGEQVIQETIDFLRRESSY